MKDYSAMSDFEINKQVAIIQGHKCYYDNGSYTNGYNKISVIVKGNGRIGQYDPCNRAEDAWPIILENKISMTCHRSRGHWSAIYDANNIAIQQNPFRAAMIVYLQMNVK